ncbi:hypothetical protein [Methyloligella solikamskensis]|uniref:Uncharacterized protein n=1 Tax=Methyloligella solikamskensis TaxID=1177756 RepID=A0ABW3J602_9HYPH
MTNQEKGPRDNGWPGADSMKILDLLAKLGILRYGAKAGTYRSEAERPTEFMMDDVFDADRDLVVRKGAKGETVTKKKENKG